MRKLFFKTSFTIFALVFLISYFQPIWLWTLLLLVPLFSLGTYQAFQTKKAILRNFPLIGGFRYLFEMIRPEIQQYFVESETDGTPVPREIRSVVYQRTKEQTDTLPFGTQRDVYKYGYEWISHSLAPKHIDPKSLRVLIGGPRCKKPYLANIFNISAMSYGALSKNAVLALNGGAKLGNFYHNTGEGGLSPHHLKNGGDLVWQIGTGYFGCRDDQGQFAPEIFKVSANLDSVKMIEIKLSQGAKPSHGGILPAAKITKEIVEIRKVKPGKDVVSPPAHSAFSNPIGLLKFIEELRHLSSGKPIGFKFCVGLPHEFMAICKAMIETGIQPDFITVDGGEGGTGAAPMEFSDSVGSPLEEGLTFVHNTLVGFGLRENLKIIASGKIMTGFNIFSRIALGADICNSARGMMLALGCIQARRCNTNHCPAGVATSNPDLVGGLDPKDKMVRVYNYQKHTVEAFADLLGAAGIESPNHVMRHHVNRRISGAKVSNYEDLFPYLKNKQLLEGVIPENYLKNLNLARPDSFSAKSLV